MAEQPDEARERVSGLIMGAWGTQVIHVAAQLRLFDALAGGPRAAAELAAETGSHPPSLFRLMRALAAIDLVRHLDGDRFELLPAGELLRTDAPGSVRGMALHWGRRLWGAMTQLDQSVRTGAPWRVSGLEGFQQMAQDPADMAMFHQSMADQTLPVARGVAEACDLSGYGRLMDVGGSYGALLAALLKAYPSLSGEVYDLAGLSEASTAYLEGQGVGGRARFVAGSFFESVPAGAGAYLLKSIIHDWDDAEALQILRNVRAAAAGGAAVLVIEQVAPAQVRPGGGDLVPIRADIMMLTATGGKERTVEEYRALFEEAGLALTRVVPTASAFSVLEAGAA